MRVADMTMMTTFNAQGHELRDWTAGLDPQPGPRGLLVETCGEHPVIEELIGVTSKLLSKPPDKLSKAARPKWKC
jgi:hypothetical protein